MSTTTSSRGKYRRQGVHTDAHPTGEHLYSLPHQLLRRPGVHTDAHPTGEHLDPLPHQLLHHPGVHTHAHTTGEHLDPLPSSSTTTLSRGTYRRSSYR